MNRASTAQRLPILLLLGAVLLSFAGCTNVVHAPVADRSERPGWSPSQHRVRPGETLYSIAFQYGMRYEILAQWNGLRAPYTIKIGQTLNLHPPATTGRSPAPGRTSTSESPNKQKQPPAATAPRPAPAAPPVQNTSPLAWKWPAQGRILRTFQADSHGKKGIEIEGSRGQPVRAAASGRVVYAGSGLVGYGRLIIIKHNERFLSAYGYNDKLFVQEGSQVHVGQVIAEMGSSGTNRVQLHFEIRRDGKSVDPLQYLPRR